MSAGMFPNNAVYPTEAIKMLLHVGPITTEKQRKSVQAFRDDGGKVIFIVTPEEKKKFELPTGDGAVEWRDDPYLGRWMFENFDAWKGGQIGGEDANEANIQRVASTLYNVIELVNFDASSAKVLGKDNLPLKNALQNWRYVEDGIKLGRTHNAWKGRTAVLIAAGPSLNAQWKQLAELRRKHPEFMFVVCGRSYKQSMREGIESEFVVEAEEFEWNDNLWMFAPQPPPRTVLATPINVCPGILKHWPGEKLVLVDHNTGQLFKMKLHEETIDGGNSVLHIMANLAVFVGCEKVYLAGVDFGYPKGLQEATHATGTFHNWDPDINKQESMYHEPLVQIANDGTELQSSPAYRNFATFLTLQINKYKSKNPAVQFYTFSPRGLKMEGVEYVKLEDLCSSVSPASASSPSESSLVTTGTYQSSNVKIGKDVVTISPKVRKSKSSLASLLISPSGTSAKPPATLPKPASAPTPMPITKLSKKSSVTANSSGKRKKLA